MVAINVHRDLFGPPLTLGNLRMGDLIACCNFLEYLRADHGISKLQMYIPDDALFPQFHILKMRNWLETNTNYITTKPDDLVDLRVLPGTDETYANMYNLWNIRQDVLVRRQNIFDIPDTVVLPNKVECKKKVVLCPLLDAPYNADRNWTLEYVHQAIEAWLWNDKEELILISKEPIQGLDLGPFTYSHDFETNLQHVMDCHTFIGGDTGFSHFASALIYRPYCYFHYPKSTYGTTNPFYWKTKGNMIYY